jgi:aminopeptidase N
MRSLHRDEAAARSADIAVLGYEVDLDLTRGPALFGSVSTVRFRARRDVAATFAEITAPFVYAAELDGTPLEVPTDASEGFRIPLRELAEDSEHTLVVRADCAYSHTGEGLHRFVDPADGEAYTYAQTFIYDASRVFACFDQPDLKAPLTLSVTAPEEWTVLSTGKPAQPRPGRWEFPRTPPLATYFSVVVAGPYATVDGRHGDLELGVHCRRSLAAHLDADEILEITRQCFDAFAGLFGVDYPWGRYDQVFVPEFNAGAMENPGCVTIRDEYVFRSQVTEAERQTRADIVAHEMAHMWFGDLVTMRWWDDLWLNESFAEYLGYRVLAAATRFTGAWTEFCTSRKAWGYNQDLLPTTHPIAGPKSDTISALQDFDGISYAKGASALRQLVHHVGDEAFLTGLRAYMRAHAFGTATLADLLSAIEAAAGQDLDAWARVWLETPGLSTITADVRAADGLVSRAVVQATADPRFPVARPHHLTLGIYDETPDGDLVRREAPWVHLTGSEPVEVPSLIGQPLPALVLPNDGDETFARLRLDRLTLTALDFGVDRLPDSLARAVCWVALWDAAKEAELRAGRFVDLVATSLGGETDPSLRRQILAQAGQMLDVYGRPALRIPRSERFAGICRALAGSTTDADLSLAATQAWLRHTPDAGVLRGVLDAPATTLPAGVRDDPDLRWSAVERLAALGAADEGLLAAEGVRDPSSRGQLALARARASLPTAPAKARAWDTLLSGREPGTGRALSQHELAAVATGFWQPQQDAVTAPYAERYLTDVHRLWDRESQEVAQILVRRLYPTQVVGTRLLAGTDALLAGELPDGLRRVLLEQRDLAGRVLRTREADA